MRHTQAGFTLLQTLLYVSLLSIVVFATAQVLITLLEARETARVIATVESEAAFVLEDMTQRIRNAEAITTPTLGVPGNTLVLDVVDVADDPTTYTLSSGVLTLAEGINPAVDLTSSQVSLDSLVFENLGNTNTPGSVRITLTLSYNSTSNRAEYDYTQTFTTAASIRP